MLMKAPKGMKEFKTGFAIYGVDETGIVEISEDHVVLAKEHKFVEYAPENETLEDLVMKLHTLDPRTPTVEKFKAELREHLADFASKPQTSKKNDPPLRKQAIEGNAGGEENTDEAERLKLKKAFLFQVEAARNKADLRTIATLNMVDVTKIEDRMQDLIEALKAYAETPGVVLKLVENGK